MGKKIIVSMLLIICVSFSILMVNATTDNEDPTSSIVENIFNQANGFKPSGNEQENGALQIGVRLEEFITKQIVPIVEAIGNLVFAGVTVILGMKYIWSSAEGKAEVLESLPSFVLAVVFFNLGGTLVEWLQGSLQSGILGVNGWDSISDTILNVIYLVVQLGSFAGILVLGLRYMFASAEGKAKVKANFGVFAIGLLFVFSASNVLNFIIKLGDELLRQ